MAKRALEDVVADALRELEAGEPVSPSPSGGIDPTPWLQLRDRLGPSSWLDASTHGRNHGRQRMLAALTTPSHTGGLRMIPSLFAMVPKAAMLVIGGLVLTGGAVGASAAVGGPNLPVAALTAIGLHADAQSSGGIGHAPDAAQTGKDHANGRAAGGSGNASASATATASATGTAVVGINHAPDAAQTGKDHANERAFLGAGNASVDAAATVTAEVGVGIGHAPVAAQTGVDHAAANASLGAVNGSAVTVTAGGGLANAAGAAQVGIDHATTATANAGAHRP